MLRRLHIIGLVCTAISLARDARAQDPSRQDLSRQVRFIGASASRVQRWQGYIERVTPDSLYLRVRGTDSTATFLRSSISSLERERIVNTGAVVGAGCLAVGVPLGALGYFGTHDPDSPGLQKVAGALGFVVGCGAGAVGGLIVSAVRAHGWEAWTID
jgi:hypothetical protein